MKWSPLGLGCVTFGREIDRTAAFAMMDRAVERGLTAFDTATAYGSGASETLIGEWLANRSIRDRVTLATKLLPPYSPATIESALSASLARLKVPTVDILYLHRWDPTVIDPAVLQALDALVQSGRVRALGASNFTGQQLDCSLTLQAQLGTVRFQALQNVHNFAVRGIDESIRELCERWEVAIVTYSPLGAGFLTGKHAQGVEPGSRFAIIPGHQAIYFNEPAQRRLARLKDLAARNGLSLVHLALAWAFHQPQIATVLVGGRTPEHIDQAVRARAFDAPELFRELDAESSL